MVTIPKIKPQVRIMLIFGLFAFLYLVKPPFKSQEKQLIADIKSQESKTVVNDGNREQSLITKGKKRFSRLLFYSLQRDQVPTDKI